MTRLLYLSGDPGVPVLGHKGASVHVRALARALAEQTSSVVLASPRVEPEGEKLDAPIELVPIEGVLPKRHADADALAETVERQTAAVLALVRERRIEAIYERHSLFGVAGVRVAATAGIPHVLEVNAPLRAEALAFRGLPHPDSAATLEAETFAGTDRILAVSPTLAGLLASSGVEQRRIEVVENAIDPAAFPPPGPRRAGVLTIGFAGSLKPWHGIDVLVDAFRLALAEEPAMRLEIIGEGPAARVLDDAGLPGALVRRHGLLTHAETLRTMRRWHVGVAPFHHLDDFYFSPLKLAEYMATGLCAVASDLPELRRLLDDGKRGVLVEPGSSTALAEAFVALARDRGRAAELGRCARRHALSGLSWRQNATRALHALRAAERELAA